MKVSSEVLSWPTGDISHPPGADDSGAGALRTQSYNELSARVIMPQGQDPNIGKGLYLEVFQGSCHSPLTTQEVGRTASIVIQNHRVSLGA